MIILSQTREEQKYFTLPPSAERERERGTERERDRDRQTDRQTDRHGMYFHLSLQHYIHNIVTKSPPSLRDRVAHTDITAIQHYNITTFILTHAHKKYLQNFILL